MTKLSTYVAIAALATIVYASPQSFAASAPNAGTDVFGYQRQAVDTDGTATLFRSGLVAFKAGKFKQARLIWEMTARLGDGASQYMLAHMHRNGLGGDADKRSSYRWYVRAAGNGVAAAQYQLGEVFFRLGNIRKTLWWWSQSAKAGYVPAQCNLGMIHLFGYGVKKRPELASTWLLRAANHGSARAQFYVGVMYLSGDGVATNVDAAKLWLAKSFDNGFDYANAINVTEDIQQKIDDLNLVPTQQ